MKTQTRNSITIYTDKELKDKLETEAIRQKRSLSNFIISVLISYFENNRPDKNNENNKTKINRRATKI